MDGKIYWKEVKKGKKKEPNPNIKGNEKNGKMEKKKRKWENGWLRMRKQKQKKQREGNKK